MSHYNDTKNQIKEEKKEIKAEEAFENWKKEYDEMSPEEKQKLMQEISEACRLVGAKMQDMEESFEYYTKRPNDNKDKRVLEVFLEVIGLGSLLVSGIGIGLSCMAPDITNSALSNGIVGAIGGVFLSAAPALHFARSADEGMTNFPRLSTFFANIKKRISGYRLDRLEDKKNTYEDMMAYMREKEDSPEM